MDDREYQRRAVNRVLKHWNDGARSVCLVSPTGSGKSVMGEMLVAKARAAGFGVTVAVPRRELVGQLLGRLGERASGVGPDWIFLPGTPIHVGTVQSLLAREVNWDSNLLWFDECHHTPPGADWSRVYDLFPKARVFGTTATPGRSDGQPLGGVYQKLVVAATYSQLLADKHIVPCEVFHPPEQLRGIAVHPVEAYKRYAPGKRGFLFTNTVQRAYDLVAQFCDAGVPATLIEAETESDDRRIAMGMFRDRRVQLLVSVGCLTEGVDVPDAELCILDGLCSSELVYVQKVGRVLRASTGKTHATLLDLSGSCLAHGLPTQDREYSLDGPPMRLSATAREATLRVCLECGFTWEYAGGPCPRCGFQATPRNKEPRIYDVELKRVYAGEATPDDAKKKALDGYRDRARRGGMSIAWVIREYRQLFGERPPGYMFTGDEKAGEWDRLVANSKSPKQAYAIFKEQFGCDPPRRSG